MITILLVDDRPEVLHALGRHLARHADVLTASGTKEALAVLERVEVGVVLTDYRMPPGADGVALLAEVRRRWPEVRRLLMSGDQVPGIDELIATGLAETFIAKPVDVGGIVAVLATAGIFLSAENHRPGRNFGMPSNGRTIDFRSRAVLEFSP